jgi:hypothetical protein
MAFFGVSDVALNGVKVCGNKINPPSLIDPLSSIISSSPPIPLATVGICTTTFRSLHPWPLPSPIGSLRFRRTTLRLDSFFTGAASTDALRGPITWVHASLAPLLPSADLLRHRRPSCLRMKIELKDLVVIWSSSEDLLAIWLLFSNIYISGGLSKKHTILPYNSIRDFARK